MTQDPSPTLRRQDWLAVLAHAPRAALQQAVLPLLEGLSFDWLRAPEVGLAMVRGRIGNSGDRFNLGEATLTRCALRYRAPDGCVTVGLGYVLGRDTQRAGWVAQGDALLQQPAHHAHWHHRLIEPLRAATQQRRDTEQARTAASRVQFFTLATEGAV